jgi:hypothetical protein
MEWTKFLLGGAAIGLVVGMWKQIKAAAWRFGSIVVQEVELRDSTLAAAVAGYLVKHYRRLGPAAREYSAAIDYHVRDGQRRLGNIAYERFGNHSLLLRAGWRPVFFEAADSSAGVYPEVAAGGAQKPASVQSNAAARLWFVRGTIDSDRLIAAAIQEWNQVGWELSDKAAGGRRRFFIRYVPSAKDKGGAGGVASSWQYFHNIRLLDLEPGAIGLGARCAGGMLDRLFFPDEMQPLIEEVKIWRKSQDWYESRGIPWKRGWLLYGKPGTGKTALASAFAHDLDLPIFVFNLAELNNLELMSEWKAMLASAPCIALIEDMDAVFHGRENISRRAGAASLGELEALRGQQGLLSFDVLLNCIDGVDRAEGVFTIVTTNHVDCIDPALGQPVARGDGSYEFVSTRPGRIDRAIELAEMKPCVQKRMAAHILAGLPEAHEAMMRDLEAHPDRKETPAQFQQRCNQLALQQFWQIGALRSAGSASAGAMASAGSASAGAMASAGASANGESNGARHVDRLEP